MDDFSQMIGQEAISSHLQQAIENDRVSHAYIFSGSKGSGKQTMAELFAKTLQCEKKGINPCGKCHSCVQADSHNHPDIRVVTHEKPTLISVDEIRRQVVSDIQIRPYQGPYKIYIIPDAELMAAEAQNALLKTIEEPPAYGVIMLLTTNVGTLLETVRSRCVILTMKPVPDDEVIDYLKSHLGVNERTAQFAAAFAQGALGRALQIAGSEDFSLMVKSVLDLVLNIHSMTASDMAAAVRNAESSWKMTIDDYLDTIAMWFRDVLVMKSTQDPNKVIFGSYLPELKNQAANCTYNGIREIFSALEKAKQRLRANVSFELTMELLYLTIRENT
ncbi:MAG: DNA polymerase III subunit delta' [Lachnospiraceae bacterium]|jgi:DNA polymerase-3 subunit delta'